MIYTIEVQVWNADTAALETLYFSTDHFITKSTDTPANIAFDYRVVDPGTISVRVSENGDSLGNVRYDIGEIVIENIDGYYDYLIGGITDDYSFYGQSAKIYYGDETGAYPSSFTKVFVGLCDGIEVTYDKLIFRLRDKSYLLDNKFLQTEYGGTNVLPDGVDGTNDDIGGHLKPYFFGYIYNQEVIACNTSKLIYHIHDGGIINADLNVYDRGIALTKGATYADQAAMEATAPAAGEFRAWHIGGYFRLGSEPDGQVTCDAARAFPSTDRTIPKMFNNFCGRVGITPNATDIATLHTAYPYLAGMYVNDESTIAEVLNRVSESLFLFYYYDNLGELRVKEFNAPEYTATYTEVYEYEILNIERLSSASTRPTWKFIVNYLKNGTVQTTDIASIVSRARKTWISKEYRKVVDSSTTTRDTYKTDKEMEIFTALIDRADAVSLATRLHVMYHQQRSVYEVTIPSSRFNYQVMDAIALHHSRFGLSAGKMFLIIGFTLNLADNTAILTLWG